MRGRKINELVCKIPEKFREELIDRIDVTIKSSNEKERIK
jgi:hypothetical protein